MEILAFNTVFWNIIKTLLILFLFSILYDWVQMFLWKRKYKIKGPFPVPVFGNLLTYIMAPGADHQRKRIEKYGDVFGGPSASVKVLNVANIELLKKIMIKDHVEFQNRFVFPGAFDPPPADKTLLTMEDEVWKRVRSIITPSFSAGKLKQMTKQMNSCAELLVAGLLEKANSRAVIDPRVHFGCYTMDVIASNAFGIVTNAFKNPDDPFIWHAKKIFSTPVFNPILLCIFLFPRIMIPITNLFKYSAYYPQDSMDFFRDVSAKIIEQRKQDNDTSRVDLLQLMLNAELQDDENESKITKRLSAEELTGQMFIVIVAGYETTASLLQYVAYVLATNPDVQDKLIAEIDKCISEDVSELKYDVIQDMPYLDQVINETLRMYPPLAAMNRMTSHHKDVLLDGYWFPANTMIQYSIYMIHHDPQLYPEPDKFIPERFLPEEKAKRDPFTFIPFGHGPRNCIGMRLALLELKIALVATLRKVKFFQVPETEVPLEVITHEAFLRPVRPVKVGVERRSSSQD
ncbi:cytochrome P450 3A29-like isoform X2 [Mya arenaria]|uniref:cytochrome P450 3A29-like isoform X2 n=1 Tax=Mya arenaria TaxID=6604 RepID=UPI0022E6FAAD|nr:cytochrome P450 3A29-like isoform X2 [Mya arenaria]